MPTTHLIGVGGTWGDRAQGDREERRDGTVLTLAEAHEHGHYVEGIGSGLRYGRFVSWIRGAIGWGMRRQVRQIITVVSAAYDHEKGDRLAFVGWSRGAEAVVRALARLRRHGLPGVPGADIRVVWVGLLDRVSALGHPLPILDRPDETLAYDCPAVHLVALDEDRQDFAPSLLSGLGSGVIERWVPGGHSDVGGSWGDPHAGLGDYSRFLLADHAKKTIGLELPFRGLRPNPFAEPRLSKWHRKRVGRVPHRLDGADPIILGRSSGRLGDVLGRSRDSAGHAGQAGTRAG